METPLTKTVMLAICLVVLTALLILVANTIILGNGIGRSAAMGIQEDMEHIKSGTLWELSQSDPLELPTAAAYNLLEHHKASIGAVHCTNLGCCGNTHTFAECDRLLTEINGQSSGSGICFIHHMTGRVRMKVEESERFIGLYDIQIEVIP